METFKSGDKKRVLPTWMTAQVAEKRKVPVKTPKARTSAAMPRAAAAARLPATRTVYCMSEAEMVDVALGILIEAQKQEQPLEPPTPAGADKPELSRAHSALSPSPSSPGRRSEDEDNEKDALPPGHSPRGPAGSDSARSRSPEEDEDMLKYVREIFFS